MNRFLLAWPAAALLAVAALFAAAPTRAAEPALPPPPQSWVTDAVGYMSPGARQSLAQRLEAYERQTGHQVLVWIGATTGDVPIEDFAVKTFEKWKVGRAAKDDGLVFFLFTEDRKMRIEVGYGLEDKVTDLQADRIIREVVAPRLQANDPDGAVTAGAAAILSTIDGGGDGGGGGGGGGGGDSGGETTVGREAQRAGAPRPLTAAQKIMIAVIGIGLLVLLVTNPSLAVWLLLNMLSGGGGGRGGGFSGGGGGGGWSGGGGRSGGGGASGSW